MTQFGKVCSVLGINPSTGLRMLLHFPGYYRQFRRFGKQLEAEGSAFAMGCMRPKLEEATCESGIGYGAYFHQDMAVAQWVCEERPVRHIDVGSRIDGFVAHVASFREIEVLDIRPLSRRIKNVTFRQCDLMGDLPIDFHKSTDSLSCLHALEHFGLGRYGDRIDVNGHLRGFDNLTQLLKCGGRLYLSVPLGTLRVEFNAHRVFSLEYLLQMFQDRYQIQRFNYVDDRGFLHDDVVLNDNLISTNCACNYGCAIFELVKIADRREAQ